MSDSPKGQRGTSTPSRQRRSSTQDPDATGINEFRFIDIGELALGQEKAGFDPYNSTQGKPAVDAWKRR
jgi:hypothetical protein